MWIFTNKGFISAVAHRDKPGLLLVRARRREHLHAALPGFEIQETPHADYRYRTEVPATLLAGLLYDQVAAIDYDNFKNSIADHAYHDACSSVWSVMHRTQPGSYYQGVTLAHEYGDDQGDLWDDGSDRGRLRAMLDGDLARCETCAVEFHDPGGRGYCPDCDPAPPY
jgi:hypothetical protein